MYSDGDLPAHVADELRSEAMERAVHTLRCLQGEATNNMPDLRDVSKWEARETTTWLLALLEMLESDYPEIIRNFETERQGPG